MPKSRPKASDPEYQHQYYQEHKEIIKARSAKWRKQHPEQVRESARLYYLLHHNPHPRERKTPGKGFATWHEYYLAHPNERIDRQRAYYAAHREKFKEYRARHIAKDRDGHLEYCRNYRQENRERLLALKKKYYEEHREEINAKLREARKKKQQGEKRGK